MVTYKGPSDAMQDLITGRIDLSAGPLPQMLPLIRDGKIRALALASARRSAQLPGVAPVAETIPGYDAGMWYGLFAPAGAPPDVVRLLSAQLASALAAPETIAKMEALGIVPASGKASAQEILVRMHNETAQWRKVVEQTGNYAN
jgi:tripartite-type tricarboxylate transporter receptor subunit TctC